MFHNGKKTLIQIISHIPLLFCTGSITSSAPNYNSLRL